MSMKYDEIIEAFDEWLDNKITSHVEVCPKCKNWDGLTHGICDYALALKECQNELNKTIERIL